MPAPSTPSMQCRHVQRPSPLRRSQAAVVAGVVTPPCRRRCSGKVTQDLFIPRTCKLANAGKCAAHRATAVEDPFPVDKFDHNMNVIHMLAKKDIDGPLYEAYQCLLADVELQKDFVTYIYKSLLSLNILSNVLFLGCLCSEWYLHWAH